MNPSQSAPPKRSSGFTQTEIEALVPRALADNREKEWRAEQRRKYMKDLMDANERNELRKEREAKEAEADAEWAEWEPVYAAMVTVADHYFTLPTEFIAAGDQWIDPPEDGYYPEGGMSRGECIAWVIDKAGSFDAWLRQEIGKHQMWNLPPTMSPTVTHAVLTCRGANGLIEKWIQGSNPGVRGMDGEQYVASRGTWQSINSSQLNDPNNKPIDAMKIWADSVKNTAAMLVNPNKVMIG